MNINELQSTIAPLNAAKTTVPSVTLVSNQTTSAAVNQSSFSDELKQAQASTSVDLDSLFSKAATTYNVPKQLLLAVAKTESSFQSDATSYCGAQGIMQLMPNTAKGLGVTDAYDPEQNIMGGAKLLSQLLDKYDGDIKLTLAGYNAGVGNVAKYNGIPPFKETQGYIKKVLGYYDTDIPISSNQASVNSNISNTNSILLSNASLNSLDSDQESSLVSSLTTQDYLTFAQDLLQKLSLSLTDSHSDLNQMITNKDLLNTLSTTVDDLSNMISTYIPVNNSTSSFDSINALIDSINQQLQLAQISLTAPLNNTYSYSPAIMSLIASTEKL